ncbi:hypothetical protein K1719_016423 [Acacia pycnantha]|nr:hypothetical protein K1719_016423 [Acacia pycnantha]
MLSLDLRQSFALIPLLWAVNCFYFWPVLRHAHSFGRIRRSSPNRHDSSTPPVIWQDNIDPDNMTCEELSNLGEAVGTQSRDGDILGTPTGLSTTLPKIHSGNLLVEVAPLSGNFTGNNLILRTSPIPT